MKFVALFSIYTLDTFLDNHNFCDIKIVHTLDILQKLPTQNVLSVIQTKQMISLLLLNNFCPVISYRRVRDRRKATNYCIRFGLSLWSVNQLLRLKRMQVCRFVSSRSTLFHRFEISSSRLKRTKFSRFLLSPLVETFGRAAVEICQFSGICECLTLLTRNARYVRHVYK